MKATVDLAVRLLARRGLVVYPTDTLWGLAVRATDAKAVGKLFRLKERPLDQPVSIAVSSLEEVEPLTVLSDTQRAFLRRELPGPVTVLLPPSPWATKHLPPGILSPSGSLGVRIPDHPVARELARRAGPITATSANRHGTPPALELAAVRAALGAGVDLYLEGAPAPRGAGSTVVDLTGSVPTVVRG